MDTNRIEGTAQKVAGRVEDAAGGLTGDLGTQAAGKVRAAAGEIQARYGATIDDVQSYVTEKPLAALCIAGGVGFLLGMLLARR